METRELNTTSATSNTITISDSTAGTTFGTINPVWDYYEEENTRNIKKLLRALKLLPPDPGFTYTLNGATTTTTTTLIEGTYTITVNVPTVVSNIVCDIVLTDGTVK